MSTNQSPGMAPGYFGANLALELRYAVPRSVEEAFRWRLESRRRGPRRPHPAGPDRITDRSASAVGPWSRFGVPELRACAGRFMEHARR